MSAFLMAPALLMLAALGVTSHDGPATVTFSATVMGSSELAIPTHDLGSGILAHVATYSDGVRHETVEMLAYAGDRVSFDAATQLVATRSGSDLKEIPVRFARR